MDLPNLTPPIDGLGLCDGDWPIPTGFGRSIDVIDSFEKCRLKSTVFKQPLRSGNCTADYLS